MAGKSRSDPNKDYSDRKGIQYGTGRHTAARARTFSGGSDQTDYRKKVVSLNFQTSKNDLAKSQQIKKTYEFDGGFFVGLRSPKRRNYIVNPEWVSESLRSVRNSAFDKKDSPRIYRRSKSAPPTRNPITWENFSKAIYRPMIRTCPPIRRINPITWAQPV